MSTLIANCANGRLCVVPDAVADAFVQTGAWSLVCREVELPDDDEASDLDVDDDDAVRAFVMRTRDEALDLLRRLVKAHQGRRR